MKQKVAIFILPLLTFHIKAQGILNNGANINANGLVQIYIDGGNQGSYLSQNNGSINPSPGCLITLEGNWTNNSVNSGFGLDAGTVILNGATQSISGTNPTTFYNLSLLGTGIKNQNINTAVGGLTTKTGIFSLNNQIYNLNSYTLTVTNPVLGAITYGSGYILSETNVPVNPSVIKWEIGTTLGQHIFPFGVGGLQIPVIFDVTNPMLGNTDFVKISTRATASANNTPWAGPSNVASVSHMFNPTIGGDGSIQTVIDRWWDITSSSSVTANVTFSYRGLENTLIPPYNTGAIAAQHWNGIGWDASVGASPAVLAGVGAVTATGISDFSPWVLSSFSAPLPIELSEFKSDCNNSQISITWTCLNEIENKNFILEKSENGNDFRSIAVFKGAGNSQETTKYSFIDDERNSSSIVYYRLKQIDFNKNFQYSGIITQIVCSSAKEDIKICNSDQGKVFIHFDLNEKQEFKVFIYDILGRILSQDQIIAESGISQIEVITSLLPKAYYVCLIRGNNNYKAQKVYVENN